MNDASKRLTISKTQAMPKTQVFLEGLGAAAGGVSLVVERLDQGGPYFSWQADVRQHAASLIKVPIMLHLLKTVTEGTVCLEDLLILKAEDQVGGCGTLQLMNPGKAYALIELMRLMICISDNTATNMLIEYLGKEAINKTLADMGLKDTQVARKLMVGDFTVFSTTTAQEITQCLKVLATGQCLSAPMRQLAMETLANQQYNDRLSAYWEDLPFKHKTGEVTGVIHDAGLVTLTGHDWIVAALFKDLGKNTDGVAWIQGLGQYILEDLLRVGGKGL